MSEALSPAGIATVTGVVPVPGVVGHGQAVPHEDEGRHADGRNEHEPDERDDPATRVCVRRRRAGARPRST